MAMSREPQTIDKSNWYYEQGWNLLLIHEVRDKHGNYIQTDSIKLPWRMIEASRKRLPRRARR